MKRKKIRIPENHVSYGDFLILFNSCEDNVKKELVEKLRNVACPEFILDIEVPKDLNSISYGKLDDLHSAINSKDPLCETIKVLLDISESDIYKLDVNTVFGFSNFCVKELERINLIFSTIKQQYSKEEIAAGVKELNFGTFGILDWYAKRMGISNQNDIRDIAWVRIFQCMKNDYEMQLYERRLNEQYRKRNK